MRSHRGAVEARGTRRQHGHSSRTLAVATQVNYERPSDGPSGFPVTVSLRRLQLFSPRRSLFICARDGHFADGSRRSVATQRTRHIIALQRRPGV